MEHGASVSDELWKLGEQPIKSRIDAEAICHVLEWILDLPPMDVNRSALSSLIHLFDLVESAECPAFAILAKQGGDLLLKVVDEGLRTPAHHPADDVLFALDVLAMYCTREGTDAVIRAARKAFAPDSSLWSVILARYENDHPERKRLLVKLSNLRPTGFLAVALLDCSNSACRDGVCSAHPFDTPKGIEQLEKWLTDSEHVSYAQSAAVALPYLRTSGRDALMALALDHVDLDVQMAARMQRPN